MNELTFWEVCWDGLQFFAEPEIAGDGHALVT